MNNLYNNNQRNRHNTEFGNKMFGFSDIYREYFKGNISDEQMTNHVSQPFWYSLRISKKRLEKNGLDMEMDTKFIRNSQNVISRLSYEKGEKVEAGIYKYNADVSKKIRKDGKVLFKDKEKKFCFTGVIKAIGDGENAICPRCGHNGKISSYIDGCDYCHSKFQVSDFEEKISMFNTETDGRKKISAMCKKIIAFFGIAMVVSIIAIIVSFIILLIATATNGSALTLSYSSMSFVFLFNALPILKDMVLAFAIISAILLIGIRIFVKNEKIVKNDVYHQLKDFGINISPNDFFQNIEYKLRNIHFAERKSEVEAFASFDLEEVVTNYENVIECFVHQIKFLNLGKDGDRYLLDVEVILRLSRLINNKIKTENEKIVLKMSGKSGMKINNISSIMEFSCNNCDSAIDILKGGKCDYCGEKMDYSEYDWIIDGYYSNVSKDDLHNLKECVAFGKKKYVEYYKKLKTELSIVFVVALVIVVSFTLVKNKEIIHMIKYQSDYDKQYNDEYEKIPKPEEIESETRLKLLNEESWVFNKVFEYEFEGDFNGFSDKYVEKICNESEYILLSSTDDYFAVYKMNKFDEYIFGCYGLYVEYKDGKINIDFSVYDVVEDFEEKIEEGFFE